MARQRTLSDTQRREHLAKINQKTAKRRRTLYRTDPAYREAAKQASRETYLQKKGGLERRNIRNAHEFLSALENLGTQRILRDGSGEPELTFSTRELSVVLGGYHPNVLRQWCREGKFPSPQHLAVATGKMPVYTLEQTRALMQVMGEHQAEKAYLSTDDKDTIKQLNNAMKA